MTAPLHTTPRIADPDALYALLMEATRELDCEASLRFCARLVLLLANHIGDEAVLQVAIQCARTGFAPSPTAAEPVGQGD